MQGAATKHFRVLLLDQRGTGASTPLRAKELEARGDLEAQVDYMRHFRADSIVADAELFRAALDTQTGEKKRWCVLGQSFGGFCCVNYLSTKPEGVCNSSLVREIECRSRVVAAVRHRACVCQVLGLAEQVISECTKQTCVTTFGEDSDMYFTLMCC